MTGTNYRPPTTPEGWDAWMVAYNRWMDEGGYPLRCKTCGDGDGYMVEGMTTCDSCYRRYVRAAERALNEKARRIAQQNVAAMRGEGLRPGAWTWSACGRSGGYGRGASPSARRRCWSATRVSVRAP